MSVGIRPEEPEQLECDICLLQIPADGANNAENDDYVLHFFGTECYRKWRAQQPPGTGTESNFR